MEDIHNTKFAPLFAGPVSLHKLDALLPKGVDYYIRKRRAGEQYNRIGLAFKSKGRTGAGDRLILQQLMRHRSILVDMSK